MNLVFVLCLTLIRQINRFIVNKVQERLLNQKNDCVNLVNCAGARTRRTQEPSHTNSLTKRLRTWA